MDYNVNSMHERCRKCITFHVVITMRDGTMVDGIVEGVDRENVNLLVGEPVMMEEDLSYERQEYGYGQGSRRRRPVRRFRRRAFPLALLAAVDVVPFFPFFPFLPF
ncbi:hypothetical protein [Clostridium isatidis]|uniref:hypothetical protein n=1 Tax=Clostridium isatidis TaxID=182773 RepID=UPI003AABFFB1